MPNNNPKHIIDAVSHPVSYEPCIQEPAYFVAPSGSTSHETQDGSFERPWQSLEKACAELKAGDHLYLREGTYYEAINLQVSGKENKPIYISCYPNETAILSGKHLTGDGCIKSLLNIQDQGYLNISGLDFRDLESHNPKEMAIAIFVHGASHNIYLGHNHISNITSLGKTGDAHGIAIYGTDEVLPIRQITISHNHLHNLKLGSSEALAINGNVEYFVVSNNRVHHCDNIGIDVIGFEGKCSNSAKDFARHGVIRRNLIYNIDTRSNSSYDFERNAAGIYVDGGSDLNIYDNVVHHCNIGVELACEHATRSTELVRLEHNLLYHNHIAGLALGGYDNKRGKTENCHIKHNHLIENDSDQSGYGELWLQNFVANNIIEHNTFRSNQQNLFISSYSTTCDDNQINNNHFHSPEQSEKHDSCPWIWRGKAYSKFEDYQKATGNDNDSNLGPYENVLAKLV